MLQVVLKVPEVVRRCWRLFDGAGGCAKVLETALDMLEVVNGVRRVLWVLGFMLWHAVL